MLATREVALADSDDTLRDRRVVTGLNEKRGQAPLARVVVDILRESTVGLGGCVDVLSSRAGVQRKRKTNRNNGRRTRGAIPNIACSKHTFALVRGE